MHKHGAYLDVRVSRACKGGRRRPLNALLPVDQRSSGGALRPGDTLRVRVLHNLQQAGRLLLTEVRGGVEEREITCIAVHSTEARRP